MYEEKCLMESFVPKVDFDFFSSLPFQPSDLERSVPFLKGGVVMQSSANTLTKEIPRAGGSVKLSFFGGLDMRRARDPDKAGDNGIYVASLLDLAATKLKTLWDRASFKDYFDLDVLLQNGVILSEALGAAKAIYGASFNPLISLKALQYFEDGDVGRLSTEARSRLVAAVKRVDPGVLPSVQSRHGLSPEGR